MMIEGEAGVPSTVAKFASALLGARLPRVSLEACIGFSSWSATGGAACSAAHERTMACVSTWITSSRGPRADERSPRTSRRCAIAATSGRATVRPKTFGAAGGEGQACRAIHHRFGSDSKHTRGIARRLDVVDPRALVEKWPAPKQAFTEPRRREDFLVDRVRLFDARGEVVT